jgi:hypothetical protein
MTEDGAAGRHSCRELRLVLMAGSNEDESWETYNKFWSEKGQECAKRRCNVFCKTYIV